jgi:DNA-binding NarL/FixJ family response regulator
MALVETNPREDVVAVFLLAENRLLREALIRLFSKKDDIHIVGSGPYSAQILDQILEAQPKIVVLDSVTKVLCQDGVIRRLLEAEPEIKVVMVGMEADEGVFLRLVQQGVL